VYNGLLNIKKFNNIKRFPFKKYRVLKKLIYLQLL
jgi:hypothetical protein